MYSKFLTRLYKQFHQVDKYNSCPVNGILSISATKITSRASPWINLVWHPVAFDPGFVRVRGSWYPTARLFRRGAEPDWAAVVDAVVQALPEVIAGASDAIRSSPAP
jgi:hypothetical protein